MKFILPDQWSIRLADTLTKIVGGHLNSEIDDLLPRATHHRNRSSTWPDNAAYSESAANAAFKQSFFNTIAPWRSSRTTM